jgi:hypothetical protein
MPEARFKGQGTRKTVSSFLYGYYLRCCDNWNEASRFEVVFDDSREVVRSTMCPTDYQRGLCGSEGVASARTPKDFLLRPAKMIQPGLFDSLEKKAS